MTLQMDATSYGKAPDAAYIREFDEAVRSLREKVLTLDAAVAIERFVALSDELKARLVPIRKQLLGTSLYWTDEDRTLGRWMHTASQRLGSLGRKLVTVAMQRMQSADDTVVQVIARSLQHIGSGIKSELADGRVASRDYRELHALMRLAISLDCAQAKVTMTVLGEAMSVPIEALYFRALLLARFANGALTLPQIDILDRWIWIWRDLLHYVTEPGGPETLRADLASSGGLRQGPHPEGLPSLYLPAAPIAEAFRSIVADFHAGRLDRGASFADLPVAEYVAVLDVMRRGLMRGKKGIVSREEREPASGDVEVFVDIAEIVAKGFAAPAPAFADSLSVTLPAAQRDRHIAMDGIYEQPRRILTLCDRSSSGCGLEGSAEDCRAIGVGSLVALRTSPQRPLVIGRVMRRLEDGNAGRVTLGVRHITSAAQHLHVTRDAAHGQPSRETLLFVPGEDSGGAQDGFLIPDALLREKLRMETTMDDGDYAFRFNRVRQKGRGWSLAGFEIVSKVSRPVSTTCAGRR